MHTQIIKKSLQLPENWDKDNYKGYREYVQNMSDITKSLANIMTDPHLDVVKIDIDFNIHVKERDE